MNGVRTLVVEDLELYRELLARACADAGLQHVGESSTVGGAIEAIERLRPELVLLDLRLGDESGMDVAAHCLTMERSPALVLFSAYQPSAIVRAVDWFGLRGFLTKDLGYCELLRRLRQIKEGVVVWTTSENPFAATDWERRLTRRELEALLLVCQFVDDEEGAAALGISVPRFARHRVRAGKILAAEGPKIYRVCHELGLDMLPPKPAT